MFYRCNTWLSRNISKRDDKFIAKKDRRIEIDAYNYKRFEEDYLNESSYSTFERVLQPICVD